MIYAALDEDISKFLEMGGRIDEVRPVYDDGDWYPVDHQYLLMNRWAFDRLGGIPGDLVDFGSKVDFTVYAASIKPVTHYDIRRPDFGAPGWTYKKGDLTAIPEPDNSLPLISCLHVAEHIGLGRYGDTINPKGFEEACAELSRVIAPGGSLLFAVPVGRPRVVFNAHRVLSTKQVIDAFPMLSLHEFSGISSHGKYVEKAPLGSLDFDTYGCGMFHFVKESK